MSRRRPDRPDDLLRRQLSARPMGTRCVLALDPDCMLDLGRTVPDDIGRVWDVVSYRGDDVATRKTWAKAAAEGRPVVLVLTRPVGEESVLDVSSIADLASRAEGPM